MTITERSRGVVFVGRVEELAVLGGEFERALLGEPRVVVIEGEAGVGKSSLLSRFIAELGEVTLIRAGGDESEQLLPYGVLAQLGAAQSPGEASGSPMDGGGPSSPLAAGAALVKVLGAAQDAAEQAVVVVVDDLHWADKESAAALLFAVRRLRADRVLVVVSTRPGELPRLGEGWPRFVAGDDRVTRIALSGFAREELLALGDALGIGELSSGTVTSLLEHTAGNPLYCRALLEELSASELRTAGEHGLRAPRALAGVIATRLAALSDAARELVVSASVMGLHAPLATVGALAGLGDPASALGEAISAGILEEREGPLGREVVFVHPLIRRAVLDDLPPACRQELHERAAGLLGGVEALDHRVAAASGADDQLAGELELAARGAAAERRPARAASWFAQAAVLSSSPADRERRLLDAFEQLLMPGDVAGAAALEPEVLRLGRSARASGLLGQVAMLRNDGIVTEQRLTEAWDGHDGVTEPLVGAAAAIYMSLHRAVAGRAADTLAWADRAVAAAGTTSAELAGIGLAVGGVALAFLGRAREGAQRVGVFPASPTDFPPEATDGLVMRGLVNLYNEELHAARADFAFAAGRQQAGVPLKFSSQSLAYLGETEFRLGAWDDGVVHNELAVSLSHDADRAWDYPFVHGLAAFVPANRGEWDVAERHITAAREVAELSGLAQHAAVTGTAAAMLAAARADPAGVLAAAEAIREAGELDTTGRPGVYDWRPYEVGALIATGRLDEAQQALDEFEAAIPEGGLQSAEVALERLRGTLACAGGDDAGAVGHFDAARDASDGLAKPFELGLLALADGQRLHQGGDRRAAIERLRNARDAFASLRAQPYLDACDRALEQLGVPAEAQRAGYGLTPAELAVARLVATGKSNRETAEELYVTVKTVEFHLRGVFAKLGISSRRQIAALLGGQD